MGESATVLEAVWAEEEGAKTTVLGEAALVAAMVGAEGPCASARGRGRTTQRCPRRATALAETAEAGTETAETAVARAEMERAAVARRVVAMEVVMMEAVAKREERGAHARLRTVGRCRRAAAAAAEAARAAEERAKTTVVTEAKAVAALVVTNPRVGHARARERCGERGREPPKGARAQRTRRRRGRRRRRWKRRPEVDRPRGWRRWWR